MKQLFSSGLLISSVFYLAACGEEGDSGGNTLTDTNTDTQTQTNVEIVDTQAPVIILNGQTEITLEVHNVYTEQGVAVTDNYDSALQAVITSDLEIDVLGNYTVTY
ncbi:MAG: DUF5011 domain-containing protein, partial [Pseudomonadales bacterium]|nr:DUF5011 domain-containing protein [Pseudomonadales bacterium]